MIDQLQKKLTAMLTMVSLLLFCGIFGLLVFRDIQNMYISDRSRAQNQLTALVYEVQGGRIVNPKDWENSDTLIRLWDDEENLVWRCDGNLASDAEQVWQNYENTQARISFGFTGEKPEIFQTSFVRVKGTGISYMGNTAYISSSEQGFVLDMLMPLTPVIDILEIHFISYLVIWLCIATALFIVSQQLVKKALVPARESVRRQKEFIAAASHELKAPLSVIQLNNEEAKRVSEDNNQAQQLLSVSLDECRSMSALITDMLELASAESGGFTIKSEELDLDTLLIGIYEKYLVPCSQKNIRLKIQLPHLQLPKVMGDRLRISQVLGILLDNAIAFSSEGDEIVIATMAEKEVVKISVTDQGMGIAEDKKHFIFDKFYRGDPSRTHKNSFGLGLSIAKEIIALHGGRIWEQDTPGGGATFVVELLRTI